MFMILVIHANMISLLRPTTDELLLNAIPTITRYFFESFGIVGVDIFVLISGWFLINTRAKSFFSFFFQILTLWGGIFLLMLFTGNTQLSVKNVLEVFAFTKWDWFVKAYIVLMIIAPILNTYVKNSSERLQRNILIGFLVFQSTYGWLGGANRFFVNGYGPLSFVGLYLLAQYIHSTIKQLETPHRIYRLFNLNKKCDLMVFIGSITINTFLNMTGLYLGIDISNTIYAYTNPFTIIAALYLLLFFSKINIKNSRIVNMLAAGSFAVYLIHSQVDIRPLFNRAVLFIYASFNNVTCILVLFVFLVLVYIVSVAIDLPRLWMWNKLSKQFDIK